MFHQNFTSKLLYTKVPLCITWQETNLLFGLFLLDHKYRANDFNFSTSTPNCKIVFSLKTTNTIMLPKLNSCS